MVEEAQTAGSWFIATIPALFIGAITFAGTMIGFRAKISEKDKAHEKEIELMQKDIVRLENGKAGNDKLQILTEDLRRVEDQKASKDVVDMLNQTLQSMDSKITKILSRLPEK